MKTKFNIVDVVIIFTVIIAIAVGCFLYFRPSDNNQNVIVENTTKIRFVIEVKDLTETAANSFKEAVGTEVSFGETATGSGVVYDVEILDYEKWVDNLEEGTVSKQKVPGRYMVNVTVESDVTKSDTAYTSGKETIAVGKELPFSAFAAGNEEDCYIIDLFEVK